MEVIDRNLLAAYLLVKGTPGIAKSRLYLTAHGRDVVEWMIENHYIVQEGSGCYLGYRAEDIGPSWAAVARDAEQDEDVEQLIRAIEARYSKRLVRKRGPGENPSCRFEGNPPSGRHR